MQRACAMPAFVVALFVAAAVTPREARGDCPRSPGAVTLSNEADQLRATNVAAAIAKYEEALRLEPSNHRLAYKLATAHIKKEDWTKASEALAVACKLAPTFANYFFLHGYALEKVAAVASARDAAALWTQARGALERATQLDPHYADPHFDLAEVLLRQGDDRGALAHYVQAIRLKPDEIAFYAPLADFYLRAGFVDAAQQAIAEGLSWARPDDTHRFELLSLSATALERKGDHRGAFARFAEARAACGACNEHGEQIAFFNLGAAAAGLGASHKDEARANLTLFTKMICRGGAASRYADECMQTQELLRRLGP